MGGTFLAFLAGLGIVAIGTVVGVAAYNETTNEVQADGEETS